MKNLDAGTMELTGVELEEHIEKQLKGIKEKMSPYGGLWNYLTKVDRDNSFRVCVIYGKALSGKTTMMYQAINDLINSGVSAERIIYVNIEELIDSNFFAYYLMDEIAKDYDYIFIDNISDVLGIVTHSQWISDLVVSWDKRVVITGGHRTLGAAMWRGLSTRYEMVSLVPEDELEKLFDEGLKWKGI